MPYKYEIIQEIEDCSENIYNLEIELKKYIIKSKIIYKPLIYFAGSLTECYSLIS
jgi:hypothetical protein